MTFQSHNSLAFFLAYLLTFFLALFLAYLVTFFSDILSGALSGISPDSRLRSGEHCRPELAVEVRWGTLPSYTALPSDTRG